MSLFDRLSTKFKRNFLIVSTTGVFLMAGVEAPILWQKEKTQRIEYAKAQDRAREIENANNLLQKGHDLYQDNPTEALRYINNAKTLLNINADKEQLAYFQQAFLRFDKNPLNEDLIDSIHLFLVEAVRKFKNYEYSNTVYLKMVKPKPSIIDSNALFKDSLTGTN